MKKRLSTREQVLLGRLANVADKITIAQDRLSKFQFRETAEELIDIFDMIENIIIESRKR